MHIPSPLTRLAALSLGLLVLLSPVRAQALPQKQQLSAASAPAPLVQESHPGQIYRQAAQKLTALGYDTQTVRALWTHMGADLLPFLDSDIFTKESVAFLLLPNSRAALLGRYLSYASAAPELTAESVVLQVNMGLDIPFYEQVSLCSDPASLTVLVNKYNALPDTYVPELEALGSGYGVGSLRPEASLAFRAMADAAREEGISLRSVSSYRSYNTQANLHRRYVNQSGQALADTFSARAGHSEHQTGLALDINTSSISAHFENTPEFAWLQENCARFGFLLRYPEGKDAVTGYRFEPWHYRYVGLEAAQICMEQGLTYEEYLAGQPSAARSPALFWQEQEIGAETLVLEDRLYVSPAQLCPVLGWSVQQRQNGLQLSKDNANLFLVPGRCALQNGKLLRLSSPVLSLEGTLFLPLDELSPLLNLEADALSRQAEPAFSEP